MRKNLYITLALVVASFFVNAQTWEINGPTSVCHGQQNVTYSVQSTTGGLPPFGGYTWKLDGATVANTISPSYDLDIPTTGSSFFLEVNGPSSLYASLTLTAGGNAGTISLNGDACSGASVSITVSGQSGNFEWLKRTGSGLWSTYGIGSPTTLNDGSVSVGTQYQYRTVVTTACGTDYSNIVTVTPRNSLGAGTASGNQSICSGETPSDVTATSASGGAGSYTYSWEKKPVSGGLWINIGGGSSLSSSEIGALTQATKFRRKVTDTQCGTNYTNEVTVSIHPSLSSGSIGNVQTVCYNGNPSTLTNTASASGGNGSIAYQWQYSTNGTSGWTNLSGQTGTTYNPPSLTSNRWYRRRAISCNMTVYTNSIKITVQPDLNVGSIGNAQTVCYNGNPAALTNTASASGGNGSISYQWQYSANGSSGWTDLSGQTGTTYDPPSLTSNRWYRRRAISCGQTKYTNSIKITVRPTLNPGSIGNAQTLCYNGNATSLTNTASASGGDGSFSYQWQYSTNGINGWTNLSGQTGTTYDPPALTATRWYRRRAISCGETKYTNSIRITIHATLSSGSIGNAQTVCYNGNASALTNTASASGGDGASYQWQYSTNGTSGWTNLNGQTSTTYDPPALTADRWYRREASSCGETVYTNSIKITVHPSLSAGSIGNAQTLCYNENPAALTNTGSASGGDGSLSYQWQYSLDGSTGWNNLSGQTATTYNPPALTQSRWYRRRVISCGETKYTNSVKITIHPDLNPGAISGAQSICYNNAPSVLGNTTSATGGGSGLTYQWQESTNGISFTNISGTSATYQPGILTSDRWYRRGASTNDCSIEYTTSVKVTVDATTNGGSLEETVFNSSNVEVFGTTDVNLALTGEVGNIIKWQYKTTAGWVDIANTTDSHNEINVTVPTYYRVEVKNGTCATGYSNEVFVNVFPEPGLDFGVRTSVRPGSGTTISVDAGYSNYQWFKDEVSVQSGSSNELQITHPAKYRVKITSGGGATFETGNATIGSQLDEDQTYVMVYDFREAGYTAGSDLFGIPMENMSITADVYDGLGRPIQKINMEGSPNGSDLVAPVEYDEYGRNKKSYLPYPTTDNGQLYKPDALGATSKQKAFYDVIYSSDTAFSENKFEASPLNRVVEQGLPGEKWAIGSDHSVKMQYLVNEANENIRIWRMVNSLPQFTSNDYYPDGKLFKSVTTDENGAQTITYTNFRKDPILIKKQIDLLEWTETYYIYDQRNRLSVVLQPEGVKNISTYDSGTTQEKEDFLAAWAFQYGYDAQNRQIWKQVPGAGRMYTVYDAWDRVRMTSDSVQTQNKEWSFIKYDVLNRPIITGIRTSDPSLESQEDMTANVEGNVKMFESYSTTTHTYSDDMYPSTSTDVELLTVTFYDNYDFLLHAEWASLDLGFSEVAPQRTPMTSPLGTVTGTKTKVSDGTWIYSTSHYDDKGRLIQARSTNHLGGVDVVTNYYNFANEVTQTITEHSDGTTTTTITRDFEYDHRGRLLKTWHTVDGAPAILLTENEYNELDEVAEKRLHSTDGTDFEQYVDYTYNIRRWLITVNDSDLSSNDPVEDLFGMELAYDQAVSGLGGNQYNGNISAMKWSNYDVTGSGPDTRAYTYNYDKLSRLTAAQHYEGASSVDQLSVSSIGYDENGNIESLIRKGDSGANMDNLTYDYGSQGNRLMKVTDAASDTTGFVDGNKTGDDYTYDANGNMVKDRNKGIDSIYYNHLNLPIIVDFENPGDSIVYLYDAAGIKLQQKVWRDDTLRKTTDYVGEFIYEDGEIQLIQHEEGRIVPEVEKVADDIVWTFDSDKEGFVAVRDIGSFQHASPGHLEGIITGNDPIMRSPDNLNLEASKYDVIRIRFENNTSATSAEMFFTTTTSTSESSTMHKIFTIVPNSSYQEYTIDMSTESTWTGTIKRIRLDPVTGASSGDFKLDEMIVVGNSQIENYDYQYHLKDHLGNVRMTFSTTPENYTMVETFETGEENGWQDLHRSTNSSANTTIGGDEVELLQSGQTGAMIFINVNKGDTVDLAVNANYESTPSNNNFLGTGYNALFSSFDNVFGSGIENGVTSTSTVFNDALSGTDMSGKGNTSTAPRAFLNYIIFDKDMSYVTAGFEQISSSALGVGVHETISINDIIAELDGYILAYLSNENQEAVNVHFDDFTVYHGKTNVVSTQDYYPFGLTFNSSQRTASVLNNFKYNGKEYDENTKWYDYGARMYQADLGRWFSVDPLGEKFMDMTTYKYGMNNPILFIDPDGRSEIMGGYGQVMDQNNTGAVTHYDYGGGSDFTGNAQYNKDHPPGWDNPSGGGSTNGVAKLQKKTEEQKEKFSYLFGGTSSYKKPTGSAVDGAVDGVVDALSHLGKLATLDGDAWAELGNDALSSLQRLNKGSVIGQQKTAESAIQTIGFVSSIPSMNNYELGYLGGQATVGIATSLVTKRLFSGYGFKIGTNKYHIETLYRTPSYRFGGTAFSVKANNFKFRLDFHGNKYPVLHYHTNYKGLGLSKHRGVVPFYNFGKPIKIN